MSKFQSEYQFDWAGTLLEYQFDWAGNHKAATQGLRREDDVARETFGAGHFSFQDTRHAQEGTTCS